VVWNYCQVGGQTGINNLATLGYPPEMRSSGIGWAGGSGRIGGIAFPWAGGQALGLAFSLQSLLIVVAVPALLVAALIGLLGWTSRAGRARDELTAARLPRPADPLPRALALCAPAVSLNRPWQSRRSFRAGAAGRARYAAGCSRSTSSISRKACFAVTAKAAGAAASIRTGR
jgi:hypothetical protein